MAASGEYSGVQDLIIKSIDKMERNLGDLAKILRSLEKEVVDTRAELRSLRDDYARLEKSRNEASTKMMTLEKVDRDARGSVLDRLTRVEANQKRTFGVGAGLGAGAGGGIYAIIEGLKALMSS